MKNNKESSGKCKFSKSNVNRTAETVYEFIVEYTNDYGYPPSIRDICKGTGIKSTSTVHAHIQRLKESGKLNYSPGLKRAITIKDNSPVADEDVTMMPLLGTVTAGAPILAQENIETLLPFPSDYFGNKGEVFALKVKGDSMQESAILDGDIAIVRKQSTADYGDVIVALIDDEATVKTFIKLEGKPFLKPENSNYDLIPFHSENCTIIGKVIGVFRGNI